MSCDQKVTPVTALPSKCVGQCLNGATCIDISIDFLMGWELNILMKKVVLVIP